MTVVARASASRRSAPSAGVASVRRVPPFSRPLAVAVMALTVLLWPGPPARSSSSSVPLADLLEITFLDRDVVALDGEGGEARVRLYLGEQVLWSDSHGAVGVVITDQRLLAVSSHAGAWQEARFQSGETPPADALLGDRVALATTDRRVLGFSASVDSLVEYRLGPHEKLRSVRVGENVGVVVTDRKALGLSRNGGFFETDLHVHERLEGVDTRAALATVTTSRRLLVFRAASGSWSERRRELGQG